MVNISKLMVARKAAVKGQLLALAHALPKSLTTNKAYLIISDATDVYDEDFVVLSQLLALAEYA